jgi:alpha,alpha-trehalase
MFKKRLCLLLSILVLSTGACAQAGSAQPDQAASNQGLAPILHYISKAWDTLTRSMSQCASVTDPKLKTSTVVYLPADFPVPPSLEALS